MTVRLRKGNLPLVSPRNHPSSLRLTLSDLTEDLCRPVFSHGLRMLSEEISDQLDPQRMKQSIHD